MEIIPCEICGSDNGQELSARDRDGKHLRTVICRQCGLVYTNQRPLPSNIEEYYQHSYRLDYKGVYQPKRKHVLRAANVAISRIRNIQKYLFRGMKALDIGSGGGEVVYAMRANGVDCYGLEPNEGYGLYAKNVLGLPISVGCIETAKLPENFYDIITMYHVIEHLYSPFRALCNMYSYLKPEGLLVMECPNIEARCQTPSNRLHKAHLYNFNEITLMALAEKAGFEMISMSLSSDGGNIAGIFRKKRNASMTKDLSQNYYRVMTAWESHTNLKYLLSPYPYKRFIKKVIRILQENMETLFVKDSLTLLKKKII